MRKEDLMKYYEPLMRGYSALDVETERPFTLPPGKASYGRLENEKEAYDIKKDRHIAPAFKPAFSETEKQRNSLRMIALCIVSNLCRLSLGIPDPEQTRELIRFSAYSMEEWDRHAARLSNEDRSCFRGQKLQQVAVILYITFFDFLCEDAKALSQAQKRKRNSHPGEKTAEKFYSGRFRRIVSYLYKNGLLNFLTLDNYPVRSMAALINGSPKTAQDSDLLISATALYEDAVRRYGELQCRRRIIVGEMSELKRQIRQEGDRIMLESRWQMEKKLREEIKGKAKKRNPLINNALAQPPDSFQPRFPSFSPINHTAMLGPNGDVIQNTITEASDEADKKVQRLAKYEEDVGAKARSYFAEIVEREARYLREDFAMEIAESAFLAILNGDEIYKTEIGGYLFQHLRVNSCIPASSAFTPDLEDEDEWDVIAFPGDNGRLENIVLGETDVAVCHSEELGGGPVAVKYGAVVAEYAESHVILPIAIRKSQVKAFKKMGCSDRKARDYALIAATLRSANWQDSMEIGSVRFFPDTSIAEDTMSPEAAPENPADEPDSAREAVEEARRQRKAAEHESQMLRHEIAKLRRELEQMKGQLERSNALLELYESRDEELREETETVETSLFPFSTNRKIVLFGGFHSFHLDILKLIPGLRIIPSASRIDVTPVRNADIMFIQINNTSHSNYWTVCDAAKAGMVPYYHLNYASPRRCAEEIVHRIREMDGDRPA